MFTGLKLKLYSISPFLNDYLMLLFFSSLSYVCSKTDSKSVNLTPPVFFASFTLELFCCCFFSDVLIIFRSVSFFFFIFRKNHHQQHTETSFENKKKQNCMVFYFFQISLKRVCVCPVIFFSFLF